MENNWKKEEVANRMVVTSLKTLLGSLFWLNKYSSKSGMNSNSVYYDRFYLSWVQPRPHAVFCHVGNTEADFHCECEFFYSLNTSVSTQLGKSISFTSLTGKTSINLQSLHQKHVATVHHSGYSLRSPP